MRTSKGSREQPAILDRVSLLIPYEKVVASFNNSNRQPALSKFLLDITQQDFSGSGRENFRLHRYDCVAGASNDFIECLAVLQDFLDQEFGRWDFEQRWPNEKA